MPRTEGQQTRVIFKSKGDDFVVLASSVEAVERFRKNDSTPLVDVIDSYDIFVTGRHGAQGVLARASKSQIENEFETKSDEEAIKMILKNGKAEQTKMHQGYTTTNDAKYASIITTPTASLR